MNGNYRRSYFNRESPLVDIGDFRDVWIMESAVDMAFKKPHEHRGQWVNFVLPTLQDPGEVWLQERTYRRRNVYRCVFLSNFPEPGYFFLALTQKENFGWMLWNFYRLQNMDEVNKRRRGRLLYRKPENQAD